MLHIIKQIKGSFINLVESRFSAESWITRVLNKADRMDWAKDGFVTLNNIKKLDKKLAKDIRDLYDWDINNNDLLEINSLRESLKAIRMDTRTEKTNLSNEVSSYEVWDSEAYSTSHRDPSAVLSEGEQKVIAMADFITMSLAKGYKIRVIDSLPSYQRLCSLFGGQYQGFTEEENVCLNFFTDILTKKDFETNQEIMERGEDGQLYPIIAEEDISTIVPIIGMMCGVNIVASGSSIAADVNTGVKTRYLSSRFEEAIRISFKSRGRNAGMKEVRDYLKEVYETRKVEFEEGNLDNCNNFLISDNNETNNEKS